MKLETERLILRKPKKEDWKDIAEGLNNLNVTKNLMKVKYPFTKKNAEEWIRYCTSNWKKEKKENYYFFIELKSERKIIGATDLSIDLHNKIGSTGSWINEKYWRKGYMVEAKIVINDLAFNKLKLRKLESGAYTENKASNKMQQKIGCKLEGLKRKDAISKATGKIHNSNIYGLLKEDWKKVRPKLIKDIKKKYN
jgi:RimJ/RimL family protein N-acetyltransferase